jgi:hypothetical protein
MWFESREVPLRELLGADVGHWCYFEVALLKGSTAISHIAAL